MAITALEQTRIMRDVPVEMRDGITLYCDVYFPAATGRHPTLLARQPYAPLGRPDPDFWLSNGYAYVFQVLTNEHLVVAQAVQVLDDLHVPLVCDGRVFAGTVKRLRKDAELHSARTVPCDRHARLAMPASGCADTATRSAARLVT